MALTRNVVIGSAYSFVDNNAMRATTGLYLPASLTLDQAEDYTQAVGTALVPLSNAGLQSYSFNLGYFDELVNPATLPNESEVERKLVLVFGTANRYVDVTMEIPSPVFTIETDNTNEVDIANPLIQALADVVINGPVGLENGATAASGQQVTLLKRAYIKHRSRGASRR